MRLLIFLGLLILLYYLVKGWIFPSKSRQTDRNEGEWELESEMVKEFFWAFVRNAGITLHIKVIHGENVHHIIESIFKGVARALDQAVSIDERTKGEIPSTKGVI